METTYFFSDVAFSINIPTQLKCLHVRPLFPCLSKFNIVSMVTVTFTEIGSRTYLSRLITHCIVQCEHYHLLPWNPFLYGNVDAQDGVTYKPTLIQTKDLATWKLTLFFLHLLPPLSFVSFSLELCLHLHAAPPAGRSGILGSPADCK